MLTRNDFHAYQEKMFDHGVEHEFGALFAKPGLGKTIVALTIIDHLWFTFNHCLVVAPKRVTTDVWRQETVEWEHTIEMIDSMEVLTGDIDIDERLYLLKHPPKILLINYEMFIWMTDWYRDKNMFPYDFIVFDEFSKMAANTSQRVKTMFQLRATGLVERVLGLTGSPATAGLKKLYCPVTILDKGKRFGGSYGKFEKKYWDRDPHREYKWTIKKGAEKEIHELIDDICISLDSKDYLDMPDFITNDVKLKVPKKVEEHMDEMAKEYIELFEGDLVATAANAGVLSSKMRQLANGFIYYSYDKDDPNQKHLKGQYENISEYKIDALEEIVEDSYGSPILIAYEFKADLERMRKRFPTLVELRDDKNTVSRWNDRKIELLAVHPASGGHGLNLQRGGNTLAWMNPVWSLELTEQLNARLHRQGQKKSVMCHRLIANHPIELSVVQSNRSHDFTQTNLFNALKRNI